MGEEEEEEEADIFQWTGVEFITTMPPEETVVVEVEAAVEMVTVAAGEEETARRPEVEEGEEAPRWWRVEETGLANIDLGHHGRDRDQDHTRLRRPEEEEEEAGAADMVGILALARPLIPREAQAAAGALAVIGVVPEGTADGLHLDLTLVRPLAPHYPLLLLEVHGDLDPDPDLHPGRAQLASIEILKEGEGEWLLVCVRRHPLHMRRTDSFDAHCVRSLFVW